MTRTGTQNRQYSETETLMVKATFKDKNGYFRFREFNWNDRAAVRAFAADSDMVIRAGGITSLEPIK